jgi:phage repressor protein C with HTH and peptisase S24 domain
MDPKPEHARRLVEEILRQTGLTPTELARRAGLAPSTLTRFLNSGGPKQTLSARTLERLAAYAPANAAPEPPPRPRPEPPAPGVEISSAAAPMPYRNTMPRDVPVLGTARGANGEGAFDLNQTGGVVDRVLRGPGIAHSVGVFAIYVEGESMEPRHRPGELRYCDPNRPCRIGDDVVIVLDPVEPGRPPQAFLKELLRRTAHEVVTRQSNPEREVRFPAERVRQMIRVLTLNEVMGV